MTARYHREGSGLEPVRELCTPLGTDTEDAKGCLIFCTKEYSCSSDIAAITEELLSLPMEVLQKGEYSLSICAEIVQQNKIVLQVV